MDSRVLAQLAEYMELLHPSSYLVRWFASKSINMGRSIMIAILDKLYNLNPLRVQRGRADEQGFEFSFIRKGELRFPCSDVMSVS
ncbi:hypothetical protein NDU88_010145 [Pleurodeles waltl]|uniref:Uncharacterized protein n=1 Tax=Pleurodeles waltl TaxID=8319 RepID=A0AAV7QUV5_PLEWA|nr:hypothetical protein NDU88_010145 [Pleurodeles waltl]